MKSIFIPLILIAILSNTGCRKRNFAFSLGDEIVIPHGKTAAFTDGATEFKVRFSRLASESRCPPGATCVWEGRAVVEITINNDQTFELGSGDLVSGTTTPILESATFQNYQIHLLEVNYGDLEQNYNVERKYTIKIKIDQ